MNGADGSKESGRERWSSVLLFCALLAVGALAWWLQLRPSLESDTSALATLPVEIAGWRAEEIPLADAVEAELRADVNLQRLYVHPNRGEIWLYIGYYGTRRGGRPEHTPRGCYTGAGWGIESARQLAADPERQLRLNEYLVERGGERQLVHFWFRSYRRPRMLGGLDQNLDRLWGRLVDGRSDGALVRLSAPIVDGDEVGTRSRLLLFGAELDPLLAQRWPTESPP